LFVCLFVFKASTWLIFDITFYANGLFNATVLDILFSNQEGDSDYNILVKTTMLTIGLSAMGLPGYLAGILLIDVLGRRALMLVVSFLLFLPSNCSDEHEKQTNKIKNSWDLASLVFCTCSWDYCCNTC
jgi:hypothetical protein